MLILNKYKFLINNKQNNEKNNLHYVFSNDVF